MKANHVELMQDETVVYETGFHQFVFLQAIPYGLILLFFISILNFSFLFGSSIDQSNLYKFIFVEVILAIVILAIGVLQYMLWKQSSLIVTNKRIIYHIGWLRRKVGEMMLDKLIKISVEQGLQGKVSNFGTITFHGYKDLVPNLTMISNPFELKRHVFEQIQNQTKGEKCT